MHRILFGALYFVLVIGQVHAVTDEISKEKFLSLYGEMKMHNDNKGLWMGYDEKNDWIIKLTTRMHYSQKIINLKDIKAVQSAYIEDSGGYIVSITFYNTEAQIIENKAKVKEDKAKAKRMASLPMQRQRYIMLITQKVENNWLRPATTSEEQSCEIIVTQTMMGDVIDVALQACTSDTAFERSVERAVRKASPLPLPPDPELFNRKIYFKFKPR